MWATCVFGDVAADGGRFLARGIGSEIEASVFDGAGDVEIHHAWLDDGALIFEVEFEDAIHAREDEHEPARASERATGEAGAGAATENWHVVLRGETDDFGDFGCCGRECNEVGAAFFDGTVVLVEDEVFGAREYGVFAEEFLQRADEVAMRFRVRRWWDASHDGKRLAQMAGGVEMAWT
jgi:hypothetical protein